MVFYTVFFFVLKTNTFQEFMSDRVVRVLLAS